MTKKLSPKQNSAEPKNPLLLELFREFSEKQQANLENIKTLVQRAEAWRQALPNKLKKGKSLK